MQLLRRLGLVLAVGLYTLMFAESYVRVFDPQPLMPRYITGTPWGVRGNIPGARYWHHTQEVDVEYRIDRSGLRDDREFSFAKPAGTCRLGLFGDSFLFGVESNIEQSFAGQLERRLRDRGFSIEVLNFSVGGFGTTEMLRTYQAFGQKFDLDSVIFSWDVSDMYDNLRTNLYRMKDGRLERADAEYLPGIKAQDRLMRIALYRLVADHSELYSFIRERLGLYFRKRMAKARKADLDVAIVQQPSGDDRTESDLTDAAELRAVLELSSAVVQRAHEVVTGAGSDFFLLDIPARLSRTQFKSSVETLSPMLPAPLSVISATRELQAAARPDLKLFYEKGQGHMTPTGNAILVDRTVEELESSRLQRCRSKEIR